MPCECQLCLGKQLADFSKEAVRRRQRVIKKKNNTNVAPDVAQYRKERYSHHCEHHAPSKELKLLTVNCSFPFSYLRKIVTVNPKNKRNIGKMSTMQNKMFGIATINGVLGIN